MAASCNTCAMIDASRVGQSVLIMSDSAKLGTAVVVHFPMNTTVLYMRDWPKWVKARLAKMHQAVLAIAAAAEQPGAAQTVRGTIVLV